MNVCTDFPNSQAVQVVFISTNPKKLEAAGRSHPQLRVKEAIPHLLPPLCMDHEDHLWQWICVFLLSKIPSSKHNSTVLFLLLCTAWAFTERRAHLHQQEVFSCSDGLTSPKVSRIIASRRGSSSHVCDRRALPRRLCSPPSHSKRMILCIVILILRNEGLARWVLHRDHPRGEILSQNESYSWVKSTQEWFIHCGDFKAAWCRDEFQPGGGWHRLRVSLHIVPLAPLISFPLKPKCWLQEDEGEGPQLQRAPVVISHLVQREAGDCSKNLFCGSKYSS